MRLVRAPRWTPGTGLPLVLGALGLAGIAWLAERAPEQRLCLLSRWADIPCPSCGMTRGGQALLRGDVAEAVASNPLLLVVTLAMGAYLALRMGFGRDIELGLSPTARRVAWTVAALLLAANWIYVLDRYG